MALGNGAVDSKQGWLAPVLVVAAVLAVYVNSFRGPFIYDDIDAIRNNPAIRSLIPADLPGRAPTTISGRPVLWFTFALNFAVGESAVFGYHAVNVLIHIGAALLLYGIVRRNISSRYWGERFAESAPWLAAAAAVLWAVHPLDTESVTYVVQRAESLAGFWYLAVIYCVIRAAEKSRRSGLWGAAAVVACALGSGTKEIVATAPVVALLYDRTFLAGSFKGALRERWKIYIGLAAGWIIVGALVAQGGRAQSVRFDQAMIWRYAMTQLSVIGHYLRLAMWPAGLVLDEGWPLARGARDVSAAGWLVILLAAGSLVALWKKPWLGFLGAWFFLILAPSSSFVPILTEISAEHRMYLPLMAIVVLVVIGGSELARPWNCRSFAKVLFAGAILALGWMTIDRNRDYQTAEGIWRDAVAKRPDNARAHYNLGFVLAEQGRQSPQGSAAATQAARAAAAEFRLTLKLMPDYYRAALRLAEAMVETGDLPAAESYYGQLMEFAPIAGEAHFQRGTLRALRRDWVGARDDLQAAADANSGDAQSHYLLGVVLQELEQWKDAQRQFEITLQLAPENLEARERLAKVRLRAEIR